MEQAKCVLFSGLPGSGKTTLARQLASRLQIPIFSKDTIDSILKEDGLVDGSSLTGYHLLMSLADQQLALHISTILDAVFPMRGFRDRMATLVDQRRARLFVIHTHCSVETVYRQRIRHRVPYHKGWTAKGWDEVERVRTYFEPWSSSDALFVDAIDPVAVNLTKILKYIDREVD